MIASRPARTGSVAVDSVMLCAPTSPVERRDPPRPTCARLGTCCRDGRPARLRPDADPRRSTWRGRSSSASAAGWRPCGRKLDLFGVVVLAGVVGLAGGITRDLLIGVPPATFRDWRYLAAAGAAGLVCFFARPALERVQRSVLVFDAVGLAAVLRHRRHEGARLRPRARCRRSCSARSPASAAACCATCCCATSRPSCATSSTRSRRCSAPASLVVAAAGRQRQPGVPVVGAACASRAAGRPALRHQRPDRAQRGP